MLHKFGFGESFIHWIKILYTSPRATITTNGITSQSFTLHQGTRQGCALFAFSLFHFYQTAHSSNTTKHHNQKNSGNVQHKISLYADDILLYLQHPQVSLQKMFNIISRFSLISHYTINWNKSILLPLSDVVWDSGVQDTFFHHLHTGNIKYSDSPQVVRAFHPQLQRILTPRRHL